MPNRIIFESEEEAIECFKVIGFGLGKGWMDQLKQAGYISKNSVEEAEEMYNEFKRFHLTHSYNNDMLNDALIKANDIIGKQHEAIQYLKERQKW